MRERSRGGERKSIRENAGKRSREQESKSTKTSKKIREKKTRDYKRGALEEGRQGREKEEEGEK